MPKVSVIIPTFGRPTLVVRAIRSVLDQTVTDIEVLVIVDGSDPPTMEALASIDDPRLSVVVNASKLGAGRTRDHGASIATADWVAFLDDDDEWLPTKLEKQLALSGGRDAVVTTQTRVIAPYGESLMPARAYDGSAPFDEWMWDRRTWLKRGDGFFQTSSVMVPRRMFASIGFTEARHEDWELGLRAVKQLGMPLLMVPEPLVLHYRDDARPSLSNAFDWQRSVTWADALGPLMSRRAYSGFLLTAVARDARGKGAWSAMWPLLRDAFRKGGPTPKQLFSFVATWAIPRNLRRTVRGRMERGSAA
jgi:glycosyltransferase involved in cell wall biosynthesis